MNEETYEEAHPNEKIIPVYIKNGSKHKTARNLRLYSSLLNTTKLRIFTLEQKK